MKTRWIKGISKPPGTVPEDTGPRPGLSLTDDEAKAILGTATARMTVTEGTTGSEGTGYSHTSVPGYADWASRALDEIIRGKSINNREIVKRRIDKAGDLKTCQIVFVSARQDKFLSEILSNLKGVSALVVGEGENFAERGGEIQFYLENNRMRFAINMDAVQRARLNVSSKLLALAKIVHDPEHPKGN